MFTRSFKPIRIVGDPDTQHPDNLLPDKWISTVYYKIKKTRMLRLYESISQEVFETNKIFL